MPIDFPAQADKLRKLKGGANDALLDTWVGLVFAGWAWDDQAQEALDRLASHPYLPAYRLSRARLPSSALRDPKAMEAAARAGFSLHRFDFRGKTATARMAALEEDAPPAVHALLDAAGVPEATPAEAQRALPMAIRGAQLASLDHLLQRHGPLCALAFAPVESAVLVHYPMEKRCRSGGQAWATDRLSDPKLWSQVLQRLAQHGVDWVRAIAGVVDRQSSGSEATAMAAVLNREWATAQAARLKGVLPELPAPAQAPRPRPRM